MNRLCCSLVMFLLVALAAEAKDMPRRLPAGMPPPPTQADVNRAIDQLKTARSKVDAAQREKMDQAIAQLEAYKKNGLDAEKTLKERYHVHKQKNTTVPQSGGKIRPPLKGGVYRPSNTK